MGEGKFKTLHIENIFKVFCYKVRERNKAVARKVRRTGFLRQKNISTPYRLVGIILKRRKNDKEEREMLE